MSADYAIASNVIPLFYQIFESDLMFSAVLILTGRAFQMFSLQTLKALSQV